MLERLFHLNENRTTVRTELLAGVTTFLAMAYIIFVQPAVLNAAGMDFGAVMVATCLASAFATILMGLLANYPIAVAPAMGHNFFFAFTVCVAMKVPWRIALGAVAIAGTLFILTAAIGLRERLIVAIPASLKHAIAVGIGLLVALIGLQWGGLVADSPGTLVTLGKLSSPPALLTLFGLLVIGILLARAFRALLIGISCRRPQASRRGWSTIRDSPASAVDRADLFQLDVAGALSGDVPVILVFFFLGAVRPVGTLVGVASQAASARRHAAARPQALLPTRSARGRRDARDVDGDRVHRELHRRLAGGRTGSPTGDGGALPPLAAVLSPVRMIGAAIRRRSLVLYPSWLRADPVGP